MQVTCTVGPAAACVQRQHAGHSMQHHAHALPLRQGRTDFAAACISRQRYTGRISSRNASVVCCSAAAEDDADSSIEVDIKVSGMVCDGCSGRVADALKGMQEVQSADVDLESGIATVQATAESQLDAVTKLLPRLVETVEGLGFEAEPYFG